MILLISFCVILAFSLECEVEKHKPTESAKETSRAVPVTEIEGWLTKIPPFFAPLRLSVFALISRQTLTQRCRVATAEKRKVHQFRSPNRRGWFPKFLPPLRLCALAPLR